MKSLDYIKYRTKSKCTEVQKMKEKIFSNRLGFSSNAFDRRFCYNELE
jgi:hypothetical protein